MFMLERERAAVSAWEEGAEQFYIMRDTPQARNRAGILMPIKVGTLFIITYYRYYCCQRTFAKFYNARRRP